MTYKNEILNEFSKHAEISKAALEVLDKQHKSVLNKLFTKEKRYWDEAEVYRADYYADHDRLNYNCGMAELYATHLTKKNLLLAEMSLVADNVGAAVVTLNYGQRRKLPWLLEAGWTLVQDWMVNPNSGNKICLLYKRLV